MGRSHFQVKNRNNSRDSKYHHSHLENNINNQQIISFPAKPLLEISQTGINQDNNRDNYRVQIPSLDSLPAAVVKPDGKSVQHTYNKAVDQPFLFQALDFHPLEKKTGK